jgi:transposase-like protein
MPRRKTRRVFSKEFKLEVRLEVDAGTSVAETARIHSVHPETTRLWKRPNASTASALSPAMDAHIAALIENVDPVTFT